ncbi:MAG: hypothetical protein V4733_05555 [Verrucomicrobiota bacterium]
MIHAVKPPGGFKHGELPVQEYWHDKRATRSWFDSSVYGTRVRLSKVAVVIELLLSLVTARPKLISLAIEIVRVVIVVQPRPSVLLEAVSKLPLRTMRTQTGGPLLSLVLVPILPPVLVAGFFGLASRYEPADEGVMKRFVPDALVKRMLGRLVCD